MIFNLKEKDFGDSRYILMKEFDTVGPIARIIYDRYPMMRRAVAEAMYTMEIVYLPERGGLASFNLPDFQMLWELCGTTESMTSFVLQDLGLQWDDFLSAWMSFITNYCKILCDKLEFEENEVLKNEYEVIVKNIDNAISGLLNLFELGISYLDLIQTSRKLLEEMKAWGDARPTAMKLSEAYLNTLNFN